MKTFIWPFAMGGLILTILALACGTSAAAGPASKPAAVSAGVTVQKDIEYVPGGGDLHKLDLYLPPEASKQAVPLLMFIHGGGWHSLSKDGCPAKFLADHGYAVASINYRLLPDAIFPAQIEDCRSALRFLRANAAQYHIQPDRVGVWGGSAGGHLAALMGTAAAVDFSAAPGAPNAVGKVDESIRVQCVIEMYGVSDFTLLVVDKGQPGFSTGRGVMQLVGTTATADDRMKKLKWASPVAYVSHDTPPFLIEHGDADKTVPLEQSRVMADVLQKAGVEETFTIMPGAGHAGGAFFTEENHKAVVAFLDKHLKQLATPDHGPTTKASAPAAGPER